MYPVLFKDYSIISYIILYVKQHFDCVAKISLPLHHVVYPKDFVSLSSMGINRSCEMTHQSCYSVVYGYVMMWPTYLFFDPSFKIFYVILIIEDDRKSMTPPTGHNSPHVWYFDRVVHYTLLLHDASDIGRDCWYVAY